MAGLETSGSNPDVSLLYDINGLTHDTPGWLDRTVEALGEYGLLLGMVLLLLTCWWTASRRSESLESAASSVAALIWAPLAAGIAVLVNVPIRGLVERPRPATDHEGLDVLVSGRHDYSFVSDHATLTMAMAAGIFVTNRKYGLIGIAMALAEGFCRVYMGVHYPTDVIGGFALGTAVTLLLSPLASAALTPLTKAIGGSARAGWLIWTGEDVGHPVGPAGQAAPVSSVPEARREYDTTVAGPERYGRRQRQRSSRAEGDGQHGQGQPDYQDHRERSASDAGRGERRGSEAALRSGAGPARASGAQGHGQVGARGSHHSTEPGGGPRDPQGPREPDLAA